jgi:hypothetical protein
MPFLYLAPAMDFLILNELHNGRVKSFYGNGPLTIRSVFNHAPELWIRSFPMKFANNHLRPKRKAIKNRWS